MEPADVSTEPDPAALNRGEVALRPFLCVAVLLGLVLTLVHLFGIEERRGLLDFTPLILGGFLVHSWLPLRWKLPFFLGLSLAGFAVAFEPVEALTLVGIGLGLIGICHLPLPWAGRITLLVVAGAALIALRASWIEAAWGAAILPTLGAMFVFRLVLYVYDLKTEKETPPLWERLSYFFLLPNALFPLFPIIDFKTFRRTYYDGDATTIHLKGVQWMLRGVFHLLLYRLIYLNFTPAASTVVDAGTLALYLVSGYALYLRVSGLFHLIIGILCLFGFNLPETHRHYFLASGFNDLWRRINIYWKDFMMKVVYYPIFIRLRRKSESRALVVATVSVFMISWWLHSFQWFWVRGDFPLSVVDAIFWSIFAVTVLANSLLQARRGSGRSLKAKQVTPKEAVIHSMKVVGMFSFMCALWSFWTGHTIEAFTGVLRAAAAGPGAQWGWMALALASAVALGAAYQVLVQPRLRVIQEGASFGRAAGSSCVFAVGLLALGLPELSGMEDQELIASIREERLSDEDQALQLRGYYEEVLEGNRMLGELVETKTEKPAHWIRLEDTDALGPMGISMVERSLKANLDMRYIDSTLRSNRWGMRDKDYEKAKPPGTYRFALMGASDEMGSGVENEEVFEVLVEERLNKEDLEGGFDRYEILNFATNGYTAIQQVPVLEEKVFEFEPDTVLFFAHTIDTRLLIPTLNRLKNRMAQDPESVPYPALREIVRAYALARQPRQRDADGELAPRVFKSEWDLYETIFTWSYTEVVKKCRAQGVRPVWVYLQHPPNPSRAQRKEGEIMEKIAREAGFETIVLGGDEIYPRDRWREFVMAAWDNHPNPEGHRRIAAELYNRLMEHEDMLGLTGAPTPKKDD